MSKMLDLYEKETGKWSDVVNEGGHSILADVGYFEWLERRAEVSVELEEALKDIVDKHGHHVDGWDLQSKEKETPEWKQARIVLSKARKGT